ncbi:MAG TPA: DUF177 domain-containing protein [Actinomycetota bacterium]|nr:DUF177 domain-containing protein [Actinomycetota bacterium]
MRNRLALNVVELLKHPGTQRKLSFDEPVEDLALEMARVEPDEPLHFELTAEAVDGEAVYVRGSITGRYTVTCRRCLEEARSDFGVQVAEVYRPTHDVWEEGYEVQGGEMVDLGVVTRDGVLLELPANPLCREDCKGLCPQCGANLNAGTCDCISDEGDERWGPLRALLEDGGRQARE